MSFHILNNTMSMIKHGACMKTPSLQLMQFQARICLATAKITDAMSLSDTGSCVSIHCDIHLDTISSPEFARFLARDLVGFSKAWFIIYEALEVTDRHIFRVENVQALWIFANSQSLKVFISDYVASEWTDNPNFYVTKVSNIYLCNSIL